jgi:hypothetical protein
MNQEVLQAVEEKLLGACQELSDQIAREDGLSITPEKRDEAVMAAMQKMSPRQALALLRVALLRG